VGEPRWRPAQGAPAGAYPHARGGTVEVTRKTPPEQGLSPRTWGNHVLDLLRVDRVGPIPTHVGEPRGRTAGGRTCRAYPHARGGTEFAGSWSPQKRGLSPRTWGNLRDPFQVFGFRGPIPTHVGEPAGIETPPMDVRAYPHARGGTTRPSGSPCPLMGLSPRTWGNQARLPAHRPAEGPIPTHVGEPLRGQRGR